VIEKLSKVLAARAVSHIHNPDLVVSAVLVPIFLKDGEYNLLFIQRTDRVREHKRQISFPGGAYEESDKSLLITALREAQEEVGISPKDVTVLGELDDMPTAATNYLISPWVGLIPYPYQFELDKWETEELLEVPISTLLDSKNCFSEGSMIVNEREMVSYFYRYQNRLIWGATARIMKQLLEIIVSLQEY